jgi:hypothetical protein
MLFLAMIKGNGVSIKHEWSWNTMSSVVCITVFIPFEDVNLVSMETSNEWIFAKCLHFLCE